jgi:hypoxanthine phosphoribosyltransferase
MTTSNILYDSHQLTTKAIQCATWIDQLPYNKGVVIVPILQSSFMFMADICKHLQTTPTLDFCGVSRYTADGTPEDLYMYKGVDMNTYDGMTVVIVDVLCSTGETMKFISKFIAQWGAKKVFTASLLTRQFSAYKPTWTGYTISDESVVGYGIDDNYKYRTLNYIAYE